jgi:hypothetical protein
MKHISFVTDLCLIGLGIIMVIFGVIISLGGLK